MPARSCQTFDMLMERNVDNLFIEMFDHHSNFYLFYEMGASLSLDKIVNEKKPRNLSKSCSHT
jgi:hypothetical protein